MEVSGTWYDVCTANWGTTLGQVACRALGYPEFVQYEEVPSGDVDYNINKYQPSSTCTGENLSV